MKFGKKLSILFTTFICAVLLLTSIISYQWIPMFTCLLLLCSRYLWTLPSPKIGFAHIYPSIIVVLGSGGHTWEMLKILSYLRRDYQYLPTYVMANDDILSENNVRYFESNFKRQYFVNKVIRPRLGFKESLLSHKCILKSLICFFQSIKIVLLNNPDYVLSNGPSTCVPVMLATWLLNSVGLISTKLIYIESMARIESLSLSARILRPFVNQMFSFWPKMCKSFELIPMLSCAPIKNEKETSSARACSETKNGLKVTKTAFVTVGTTEFDDLLSTVFNQTVQSILISQGFSNVISQSGSGSQFCNENSTYFPRDSPQLKFEILSVVSAERFTSLLKNSDLVISHGGAGTLIQALELQKAVIAVVNPKTVGNHQGELVSFLKETGHINACDLSGLVQCLQNKYHHLSPPKFNLNCLSNEFNKAIGQTTVPTVTSNERANKFSIVIPSTIANELHLKTLLLSLREFLDPHSIDHIHLIVPSSDVDSFIHLVSSLSWKNVQVRVTSESDLVPEHILSLCDHQIKSRSGWFKQQILKLKSSEIVNTEFYLILDSDCILRSPLSYSDLISTKEGRSRSFLQTEEIFKHPRWYRGSAKILGITSPFMNSLNHGIGVTPQILSVHVVKQLTEFLQHAHKVPWPVLLASNRFQIVPPAIWTEYTLYYLFAARSGLLNDYHIIGRNNIANYYQSAWTRDQVIDWPTANHFYHLSPAPFLIFQSNMGLGSKIPSGFVQNLISNRNSALELRRRKKIYFICSELEFVPVVGGINTFLRVIISAFQESTIQQQNVELVFCGIKCGDEKFSKSCPSISGISFKFFSTPGSKQVTDLASYFKSFKRFSTTMIDLRIFGDQCTDWILSNCQPGDICVTTMVYELKQDMIRKLNSGGIKIIHTVHSLVARKTMATLRAVPFGKLSFLDTVRIHCMRYLFWNETMVMKLCNAKCFSWAIPKILRENLAVEKSLMEFSKATFVPSQTLTAVTALLYPRVKDRIHYVPWGLPTKGHIIGECLEINYPQKQSMTSEINCIALCKIIPQKGIDVLIEAMKKVEQMDSSLSQQIKLKICGDMSYMSERAYFRDLKARCGSLKTIVVEFTGWLEGQAKADIMSKSDLLLVPSLTEPFGFCLLEGMKVGMGVISFETEGPKDIVEFSFGRLVPLNKNNDVMATNFASAIIDICHSNGASAGFRTIKEAAREAAHRWNMQPFFEALSSVI